MKSLRYSSNYQIARTGGLGHNILRTGDTSEGDKYYHAVQAMSLSIISYDNAIYKANHGDASVSNLTIPAGTFVILGAVKNITVTSGCIMAHLLTDD